MKIDKDKLEDFLVKFEQSSEQDVQALIESYIDDETIDILADHIEEFYGIEDDEEISVLCQIMITGLIAGANLEG